MSFAGPIEYTVGMIVPVAILAVGAAVIPRLIFRRMEPKLRAVWLTLVVSVSLLICLAAVLFAILYMVQGLGVASAIAAHPGAAAIEFLGLGASSALIWGPILLIVLFGLAQKTEA